MMTISIIVVEDRLTQITFASMLWRRITSSSKCLHATSA